MVRNPWAKNATKNKLGYLKQHWKLCTDPAKQEALWKCWHRCDPRLHGSCCRLGMCLLH
jgi:hypothetical protein